MNGTMRSVLGLACGAVLFAAPAAHADLPPPDACQTADAACKNAGAAYDQDGVCKSTTCTKGPPGQQITYDCLRCELPTTPSAAGAAPVNEGSDQKKDDGGCSMRALGGDRSSATLGLFALALLALAISRRQR